MLFPDAPGLRPTGDRLRETLFNWLQQDIVGSHCLDMFAGSGVLGFEAVSRGAASACLIDSNPQVCRQLQHQVEIFRAADKLSVRCQDSGTLQPSAHFRYDIVFVDPPFEDQNQAAIVSGLAAANLLSDSALVYVEFARVRACAGARAGGQKQTLPRTRDRNEPRTDAPTDAPNDASNDASARAAPETRGQDHNTKAAAGDPLSSLDADSWQVKREKSTGSVSCVLLQWTG